MNEQKRDYRIVDISPEDDDKLLAEIFESLPPITDEERKRVEGFIKGSEAAENGYEVEIDGSIAIIHDYIWRTENLELLAKLEAETKRIQDGLELPGLLNDFQIANLVIEKFAGKILL